MFLCLARPCVFSNLGGPLLPTVPNMDILQYSQNAPELAVEVIPKERLLLKSRCEELHVKNSELGKIMGKFEGIG